jgi:filamentous hemagglutinin
MQSHQIAANNAGLPDFIAMLRSVDGDSAAGPMSDQAAMLINRNRLELGALGPVFGGGGAAADVLGASPQQVAAANEMGLAAFYMAGAAQLEPIGGFSEAVPVSEPWTSSAIDAGVRWGQGVQNQGMPWENYLANQLPAGSQLPPNFKTFDFYDAMTKTAISAKTLDTQGSSYLSSPTRVYSTLEGYIDSAANFTEYTLSGKELNDSMISNRELHVAVPEQTTPQQWQQINQAIKYGQTKGVKVVVIPVQ